MTIQQHYTQHCIHTMIFLLQMPESLCFMSMSKEKRLWSRWIYVIMEEMLEYTKKQTQERYLTDPQKINYGASTLSQIRGPGWTEHRTLGNQAKHTAKKQSRGKIRRSHPASACYARIKVRSQTGFADVSDLSVDHVAFLPKTECNRLSSLCLNRIGTIGLNRSHQHLFRSLLMITPSRIKKCVNRKSSQLAHTAPRILHPGLRWSAWRIGLRAG